MLLANLLGLIPGLAAATGHPNVNWSWSILVFLAYNVIGIRRHGWSYLKQFLGPFFGPFKVGRITIPALPLAVFPMAIVEVVSHVARMLTLAVRLLGNIFAGHLVITVMIGLVPLLLPAVFLGLEFLVALVQAFIFTMLTIIYIALALEEAEH